MRHLRISIGGLMALVILAGVGFAALRSASELGASLLFTLALGLLATAILGAMFRRGRQQAFWAGFALFGLGSMLLGFGPWADTAIRPRLLTTRLSHQLYPMFNPTSGGSVRLWDVATGMPVHEGRFDPEGHFSPMGRGVRTWNFASEPGG
jgi:hypothetical protein